jgi:hypothetical protein
MSLKDASAGASPMAENMRPFSELCPEKDSAMAVRGLGLAHFDACLKRSAEAGAFSECRFEGNLRAPRYRGRSVMTPASAAPRTAGCG